MPSHFRIAHLSQVIILVLSAAAVASAESIHAGFDLGLARRTDTGRDGWSAGGQALTRFGELFGFGMRVAYSRFDAQPQPVSIPGPISGFTTEASLSIVEIIPTARIWTPKLLVRLFGQAGFGLAINRESTSAKGQLAGQPWSASVKDTNGQLAANFGVGIALIELLGLSVEALPLYHIIFGGDSDRQFVTVGLALAFHL